jgi:hypothetical protein
MSRAAASPIAVVSHSGALSRSTSGKLVTRPLILVSALLQIQISSSDKFERRLVRVMRFVRY